MGTTTPATTRPCCDTLTNAFQRNLTLLGMLCMFAACVATGLITATLTALEDEFDVKPTLLAVIVVMYDCAYVVTSLPTAQWLYPNMPRAIGGGMVLFGLASVFYGLGQSFTMFLIGQFVMGVGATPLWVLSFVHIDDNVADKHKVPKYCGRILSKTPIGVVIGLVLGGFFLADCKDDDEGCLNKAATPTISVTMLPPEEMDCSGWKYPFYIIGVVVLVLGVWFFFTKKRYDDYDGEKQGDDGEDKKEDEKEKEEQMGLGEAVVKLLSDPQLVLLLVAQGFMSFVGAAIIAFAPRFFEKTLCESKSAASYFTAIFIPFVVAAYAGGGIILDKTKWGLKNQWRLTALSQILGTPFFFGFYADSSILFVAILVIPCFLLFLPNAAILSIAKRIVEPKLRPHSMALVNLSSRVIGAIPGPIVLGVLIDSDLLSDRASYLLVALVGSGMSSLCSFIGWYRCPPDEEEEGVVEGASKEAPEEELQTPESPPYGNNDSHVV